ncbi:MAG: ferredoxin, partial [Thermosphaera sp.]
MIDRAEALRDSIILVAKLMALSAITAPKGRGVDNVAVKILDKSDELESLAATMEELAPEYGEFFARDAASVRKSEAVVLIGCKIADFKIKQPREFGVDLNLAMSL